MHRLLFFLLSLGVPATTDSETQQLASRYQWLWAQEATQQYAYALQRSEGARPQEIMAEYAAGEQQRGKEQRAEGKLLHRTSSKRRSKGR